MGSLENSGCPLSAPPEIRGVNGSLMAVAENSVQAGSLGRISSAINVKACCRFVSLLDRADTFFHKIQYTIIVF